MNRTLSAMLALLAACGGSVDNKTSDASTGDAPNPTPVACGSMTCGALGVPVFLHPAEEPTDAPVG